MKRVVEEEWLDTDLGTPREIAESLRSIGQVNRYLGGNRTHTHLLRTVARRSGLTRLAVLEAAAGLGQVPAAAARALAREGITVDLTLLDLNPTHLPEQWPADLAAPQTLAGNALAIPLADKSVDVVACCLFLHHLSPPEVSAFLREGLRVARRAVVINDLERTRTHALLAKLRSLVDPSRLSRHDGPVSVRRAYTRAELKTMAAAAGTPHTVERRVLYRLAAILWA